MYVFKKSVFLSIIWVCLLMQCRLRAMETAVISLQVQADSKMLPLIRQLLEVSNRSQTSDDLHALVALESTVSKGNTAVDQSLVRFMELHEALTSLDVNAIEKALVKQFIPAMMARLSSVDHENEVSELFARATALLLDKKEGKDKENNVIAATLTKILPEVIVEALFNLCQDEGYTRLIIACELSGSEKMDQWIKAYVETDEGKKELELEVGELTPLISAGARGSIGSARLLIDNGVSVNQSNGAGDTPLLAAASNDKIEIIDLLLANKAYINWRNKGGFSALHSAVRCNKRGAIIFLIGRGADANLANAIGDTPIITAILSNNLEAVKLLLEGGASYNKDGKNVEMKCAINRLKTLYQWSKRDAEREARAKQIIVFLAKTTNLIADAQLREGLESVGMSEVVLHQKNEK